MTFLHSCKKSLLNHIKLFYEGSLTQINIGVVIMASPIRPLSERNISPTTPQSADPKTAKTDAVKNVLKLENQESKGFRAVLGGPVLSQTRLYFQKTLPM